MYVERVPRHATVLDDPRNRPAVTRDRNNDYLVALARHARLGAIVSGDHDLLEGSSSALAADASRSRRAAAHALKGRGLRVADSATVSPRPSRQPPVPLDRLIDSLGKDQLAEVVAAAAEPPR